MGREFELDKFEKKKRAASKKQRNEKADKGFKPVKNAYVDDYDIDEDFEYEDYGG